jgi:hypothetical protein
VKNFKNILLVSILALFVTLGSGFVPHWTISQDPKGDYEQCRYGCPIAGAGYPMAYVVDKRYISPVNSADVISALIGDDKMLWGKFIGSVFFLAGGIFLTLALQREKTKH